MTRLFLRWSWTLALGVLLLVVVGGVGIARAAPPVTRYVDGAGVCGGKAPCYTTIQVAIDAAVPADVVYVYSGTYHEHVLLGKAITLRGASVAAVIVDGGGSGNVVTITANGAKLTTLTIRNGGSAGVRLEGNWGGGNAANNQLSSLRVVGGHEGIAFAAVATGNVVSDSEIVGTAAYTIQLGDTGNSGNQFLRLNLHDNLGAGLWAYAGSGPLLLKDSTIERNGSTGVQVGWSSGYVIENTRIVGNDDPGIVTDTVWGSNSIVHNYIAGNKGAGIYEAGWGSTVATSDNRIDLNGGSGIELHCGASGNQIQHNLMFGNGGYGIDIFKNTSCPNTGNAIQGNFLFAGAGVGTAIDDESANGWAGNYYSSNPSGGAYTIPGLAVAVDPTPIAQSGLPKPSTKASCKNDGWWFLTDGATPFLNQGACVKFAK